MKDIIHILKRKYNDALTNTSISEELKNRESFNYFSALILQRGSFNIAIVEEQIAKASSSDKESLKDFYVQIEHTVKALEREGFMLFDNRANSYFFSSEQWRDKLEKRLKFFMVSKDDTIINFKNYEVKTALSENLKKLYQLLNKDEEEMMKFLYTASKMLPFSFNNKVMAYIQSIEHSLVIDSLQSIDFWNQKKAYIKKGEKGIDLIVPSRFPLFEYEEGKPKLDVKGRKIPQLDEDGNFKFGLRFVLKKSFDKSQVNLNQYQLTEYQIRDDYEKIVTELKYAISKSPFSKHIHFHDFESKEDAVVDLFAQISNNFSGTEEQRNVLKYLFSAYSDLYIPHQRDYPTLNNGQLSELKEAIEYSKTVARVLNIEHIFFLKEKNIYELKGKEDALSRGSNHVTLDKARENAKEIDRIEYQVAYLNEFKNEYKRGYSNEEKRTRNTYNSDDRERSKRAGHQPSEASSQRANQGEETRRVQGQQSQRDTQPNDDTHERGGLSREGGLGDHPREILSSERRGVESSLIKLHDYLGEQTYNAVIFEENFPFMEALNKFGKETIENFPNFKNQQHLKEALKNPNQYNILEVENYHGSIAHYLFIKNDYSYLYESENGSAYIEIDEPITSSTAWYVKGNYPELMQTKLGEYHVYNRQLAEYLNYPLLQNNNKKLTEAIKQHAIQELTPEHIHEVYSTLSEEEKESWQDTLDSIFQSRVTELRNKVVAPLLDFKNMEDTRSNRTKFFFQYGELDYKGAGQNIVGMRFFEIEDRLHPIKEYIQILKESETFKSLEKSKNILQKELIKNADFIQKRVGIRYELTEENRAKFIVEGQHFLLNEKGHLIDYYQGEEQRTKASQVKTSTRKETITFIEKQLIEEHEVVKEEASVVLKKPKRKSRGVSLFDLEENQSSQSQPQESPFKNFDFFISKEERDKVFQGLNGKDASQFLFDESLYIGRRDKVKEELFSSMIEQNMLLYHDYEKTVEERLKKNPEYIEYFHSEDGIIEIEKLFIDKFKEDVQLNNKDKADGLLSGEMPNLSFTAIVDNGGSKYELIDELKITQIDYVNIVAFIKTSEKGNEFFPLRVPANENWDKYEDAIKTFPHGKYTEVQKEEKFTKEELSNFEKVDNLLKKEIPLLELFRSINQRELTKSNLYKVILEEEEIQNPMGQLVYLGQRDYSILDEVEQGWIFNHYQLNHSLVVIYEQIMASKTDKQLLKIISQWIKSYPDAHLYLEDISSVSKSDREKFDLESEIIETLDRALKSKLHSSSLYEKYGIQNNNGKITVINNLTKESIDVEIKEYQDDELFLKIDELLKIGNYLHLNENGKFKYEYDASKHEIKVLNLSEHYSTNEIETIFIHRAVVLEMGEDNYLFDLSDTSHRELLENELKIIKNLDFIDEEQIDKNRKKLLETATYIKEQTGLEWEWMDENILEYHIGEVTYLMNRDADTTVYNNVIGIENGVYREIETGIDDVVEEILSELAKHKEDDIFDDEEIKTEIEDRLNLELKNKLSENEYNKITVESSDESEIVTIVYTYDLSHDKVSMGIEIEEYSESSISKIIDDMVNSIRKIEDNRAEKDRLNSNSKESIETVQSSSIIQNEIEQKVKPDFVVSKDEKVGAKIKFRNNINALDVISKLEEGVKLTTEDRVLLSRYTGWGGIPQSFYKSDNSTSKGWESEAEELKALMSETTYTEARRSTLDSFYTPVEVTKEIWRAIENMGFKGGNVLEPSIGIGGFIGTMPTKFKSNTKVYGVELDSTTAKIATELYPSVKVYNTGFQNFSMDHIPITLVIGNPPFGDIKYEHHDKEENSFRKLTIHNYFMAKAIDSLEEGGVMVMVVSNAFLDAQDDTTRKYIHKSSDLLDAIRLPNNAFKDSAHTEVTTDIVFFRKRLRSERADYDGWVRLDTINDTPINRYFTYKEENLLGEWGRFGTMYGGGIPALVSKKGQDTNALLKEAIDRIPKTMEIQYKNGGGNNHRKSIFSYAKGNITKEEKTLKIGNHNIKVGSLFVQETMDLNNQASKEINLRLVDINGEPRFKKIDYVLNRTDKETGKVETTVNHKQIDRVEGMISIVNVANDLRKAQIDNDYTTEDIEEIRNSLNGIYDVFVKKHGYLSSNTNKRLFSLDVDAPFLLSLERKYDKGVTSVVAKKTGEASRSPSAIKSEIFTTRTQYPYSRPERAENEEEALYIALGESGFVDIEYMSSLLQKSEEKIEKSLENKGFIFNDPVDGWIPREEYLSGDVKKKYLQTTNPDYLRALKEVIPKDIEPYDISVQLGAGWIPESDMNVFLKEITENDAQSTYVAFGADWTISINPTDSSKRKWETDRADFKKIIISALNNKQIIIHDTYINIHGNEAKRVNEDATIAANDKMEALKEKFDKWIWSSEERRERLGKLYNDKFNRYAPREYDGSHLRFIGKVDDSVFELRPHQRDAVYRGIVEGKILLDHTVGTGKTATLICTVMEMKRMNKVNKQLLAVPNHLVGQWSKEWLELYPNANILASDKKDFEKSNRQLLFSKMTTGNYDVIIIAHSQLTKIQNDPEFTKRFLDEQIETINNAIDQVREIEGKDTRTVKQYEKNRAKLEEQVESLLNLDRDELITFKELGVDALAVDEAHEFKNLQYTTSLQRVGGLGNPEGSKKAFDLFIKARMLGEETGEKNLFFLTGTPISNTIAEMYTMQKYMDYNQLKENDILHFDAWVKQYAEVVSDWELSPSGKYQMRSRLSKFKNMPELMQSYRSFADVVTREQIQSHLAKLGKKLSVPDMIGGKPNNVINERSEQQAMFIGVPDKDDRYPRTSLVYRSENIPKKPKKGDDNMLVIMSEARKCALDMRLINPNAQDDKNSKVNIMLEHLLSQYKLWNDFKGAQLIFCDLSTPKNSNNKEKVRIENLVILADTGTEEEKRKANRELSKLSGDDLMALKTSFDVYNDIKSKLIGVGIPEKEIAFIHDANSDKKKAELFDQVNGGNIRFLLGSTSKMGAGMNAQQKLVGLHHLDAPWRPSDLEQREGRIIRQGNFLYNLFDVAKKYSDDTSQDNFRELAKALKMVGMKYEEFREALEKLPSKKFEVMVNRYATKATLDSRMWQTLETKAKFIEQIKLAGFDEREVEDISLESSNSAEMKAISSGNPLILEEMTLKKDIKKLEALAKNHMFTQFNVEKDIERLSKIMEKFPQQAEEYKEDIQKSDELKKEIEKNGFSMVINNKVFDSREEAGIEILNIFNKLGDSVDDVFNKIESFQFGKLGDFNLFMEKSSGFSGGQGVISLEGKDLYEFQMDINSSAIGLSTRIVNLLNNPIERYNGLVQKFKNAEIELPKIKKQVEPFDKEDELFVLKDRYKKVIIELRPKDKKEEDIEENIEAKSSDEDAVARSR
jgi:N12 class adenine-specific DNA methylase